ncbi:MAG: DNA primase [Anaerolineae bacterium]|nr:DNA primase [Chloroflexi bacterium CFX1]MCQ3948110.1 DNA primase [Anaerolineae bacterium]RIK24273.1 MAG: DNA primase [Anaerolineae bacterium]
MSTIDEIKSRIDIVDLVSEAGVKLRHTGRNYTGFCPFHDNKRTPAFVVWPETGTWRCFGACNEGGDIFKFVMKKEGIDFKEALEKLAARAGVTVESFQRESPEQKEAYDTLRKLLEDAVVFYRGHLLGNAELLRYLREKRGLTDSAIETFGLGYAPRGYDTALKHFTARGYSEQELVDAGLLTVREADQSAASQSAVYDRFRHRIMIPICDEQGRMAGFGARIVDSDDIPKFLNSPETPIFSKGRLLYGLDRARKPIRAVDQAVIVEGYFDVIALHQAGYENVVSPMGTALTEDQLRLLKRSTRRIVLALDPDTAGQKAILRGLDAARSAMDREGELGFDARGLLRNEARLQADLRVASLPDGLDPDEIAARDKDEWARLIENARPIVTHVMETLAAGQDLNDAKTKNLIAAQVIPLIEDLPTELERDTYRQALARMLRVDESALIGAPARSPGARRRRPIRQEETSESVAFVVPPGTKSESYCLGILFRRPELLYRLDRRLQESGLASLSPEDFEYTDHQVFLSVVRQSLEQVESDQHQYVAIHLPDSLQGLAQEFLAQTENLEPLEDKLLEELQRLVQKLRRARANRELTQTRFLQEESQQDGDPRASLYQQQVLQLTRLIQSIDQANRRLTSKRKT